MAEKFMTRHKMRENAFVLTFESIFNQNSPSEIVELARESEAVTVDERVEELFLKVYEQREILDKEIEKYLKDWSLSRISKVSLAVLRIAMYEIMFCDDIDTDIAISEAVKIAQDYTVKEEVSFINGVLSSVSEKLKEGR